MSVALLAMALVAPAARAELLPSPEAMVLPSDQPAFNDMMSQLTSRDELDSKSLLAALDVALAKLREPTKLRGFIQFSRSSALLEQDRTAEALDAIEESFSADRAKMATRAPRSASISAARRPIPLDAPVTTATVSPKSAMCAATHL